jgi:hypothetical protein
MRSEYRAHFVMLPNQDKNLKTQLSKYDFALINDVKSDSDEESEKDDMEEMFDLDGDDMKSMGSSQRDAGISSFSYSKSSPMKSKKMGSFRQVKQGRLPKCLLSQPLTPQEQAQLTLQAKQEYTKQKAKFDSKKDKEKKMPDQTKLPKFKVFNLDEMNDLLTGVYHQNMEAQEADSDKPVNVDTTNNYLNRNIRVAQEDLGHEIGLDEFDQALTKVVSGKDARV